MRFSLCVSRGFARNSPTNKWSIVGFRAQTSTQPTTSIKSIDLAANTYMNIGTLTSTVQGYINELVNFSGAKYGGVNITNAMIEGRDLILAIPGNASAEQMQALNQLVIDALNQGVNLILQVIK